VSTRVAGLWSASCSSSTTSWSTTTCASWRSRRPWSGHRVSGSP